MSWIEPGYPGMENRDEGWWGQDSYKGFVEEPRPLRQKILRIAVAGLASWLLLKGAAKMRERIFRGKADTSSNNQKRK